MSAIGVFSPLPITSMFGNNETDQHRLQRQAGLSTLLKQAREMALAVTKVGHEEVVSSNSQSRRKRNANFESRHDIYKDSNF